MGFLSQLFGKTDPAKRDASLIYNKLMKQSRRVSFYGAGRFPDNYDGRIDVLTLHIAIVLEALRREGENGNRLGQAIFDIMKDDFEVALREEGLSDTGVAKRIKPMIRLFYTRVKSYTEAFETNEIDGVASDFYVESDEGFSDAFRTSLRQYVSAFRETLRSKTFGEIALAKFDIPKISI